MRKLIAGFLIGIIAGLPVVYGQGDIERGNSQIFLGAGSVSVPSLTFVGDEDTGFYWLSANQFGAVNGGDHQVRFSTGGLILDGGAAAAGSCLCFEASVGNGGDVGLYRVGAEHMLLKGVTSTNDARFSVANTFTSATNFEFFSIDWQTIANTAVVATRTGSAGGTARNLIVGNEGNTANNFYMATRYSESVPYITSGYMNAGTFGASTTGTGNLEQHGWFQSTASSGDVNVFAITPTYNQTGTAGSADLYINRTNTAIGSGSHWQIWAGVAGTRKFSVDYGGSVVASNAISAPKLIMSSLTGSTDNSATTTTHVVKKTTGIADNSATTVYTVTIPNANNAAIIKLRFLSSNGSTDAFESSRVAEGLVVVTRTTGVTAVASTVAISDAAIATVATGATHTLAYSVTAMSGAAGATQTFNIQVTIDDSGNVGSNQVLVEASVVNSEASGISIS